MTSLCRHCWKIYQYLSKFTYSYGVCLVSFQIVDRIRRRSSSSWASCELCSHRRRRRYKTVSSRRRRRCVLGITVHQQSTDINRTFECRFLWVHCMEQSAICPSDLLENSLSPNTCIPKSMTSFVTVSVTNIVFLWFLLHQYLGYWIRNWSHIATHLVLLVLPVGADRRSSKT